MLTHGAAGGGRVTKLHHQPGRSEDRSICTVVVCNTDEVVVLNSFM